MLCPGRFILVESVSQIFLGDFTRTGARNFSGMMKDGMNSASRYYLNQFRDAYRQATIDLMTGQLVSESLMAGQLEPEGDESGQSTFYEGTVAQNASFLDISAGNG